MLNKVAIILGLIFFVLISIILMTLVGIFIAGNFFTKFEFFGAIGYEAGGNLGSIFGLIIGIILSLYFYQKSDIKNK